MLFSGALISAVMNILLFDLFFFKKNLEKPIFTGSVHKSLEKA